MRNHIVRAPHTPPTGGKIILGTIMQHDSGPPRQASLAMSLRHPSFIMTQATTRARSNATKASYRRKTIIHFGNHDVSRQ